jgi:hypothetical protein
MLCARSCERRHAIAWGDTSGGLAWSHGFGHAGVASCVRAAPLLVPCQAEGRVALARILAASRLINQVRCA